MLEALDNFNPVLYADDDDDDPMPHDDELKNGNRGLDEEQKHQELDVVANDSSCYWPHFVKSRHELAELSEKKVESVEYTSIDAMNDFILNGVMCMKPQCRVVPILDEDKNSQSMTALFQCGKQHLGAKGKHHTGLWLFHCVRHGLVCAFIMKTAESERVPCNVLYTRFEECPLYLLLDFACRFQHFANTMFPEYFKKLVAMVDRFHYAKAHYQCNQGHNMDSYPHLSDVDSTVPERANIPVAYLRPLLWHLNTPLCQWFIASNMYHKKKMDDANPKSRVKL